MPSPFPVRASGRQLPIVRWAPWSILARDIDTLVVIIVVVRRHGPVLGVDAALRREVLRVLVACSEVAALGKERALE